MFIYAVRRAFFDTLDVVPTILLFLLSLAIGILGLITAMVLIAIGYGLLDILFVPVVVVVFVFVWNLSTTWKD